MTSSSDQPEQAHTRGLQGKNALITGATTGIGFEIAMKLIDSGATVTISGRSAERGAAAVAALGAPGRVFFSQGDCNDYAASSRVVEEAAARAGSRLDILVSAGAEGPVGPKLFHELTSQQLVDGLATRIFPRIFPVHAAVAPLRASGNASVLFITTDAARHPTPGEAVIGAAGASIILMTKALAREFSRWNVRVNALALTLTSDTPSWDRIFSAETFENRLFSKALARFPRGRAPTAEEVARAAAFLVSPEADQVTGQTMSVNGGLSFGGW
jgi:2-hydroxycyclohexanecarboxyl-CoA dehydrogenase